MKDLLKKIVFYLILLLLVVVPLVHTNFTEESYEFPKMFLVYFLGSTLAFTFYIYRVFFVKKPFILPNKFVTLFVLINIISYVFSTDKYTSLWGYYSRFNGGVVSLLVFYLFYIVCINFLSEKIKELLFSASLVPIIPISLYGIFQLFSIERIFSTLGQPNWLAAYLVMVLPLIYQKFNDSKYVRMKYLYALLILLVLINIFFTFSISGIIGLIVVSVYPLKNSGLKTWHFIVLILLCLLLASQSTFLKNRISDALTFSTIPADYIISDSGLIRAGLWQGSLRLSTSSLKVFLLGTGPETFAYNFPFFRPAFLNYSSEWDFILNKPHNYYLELLTETGFVSLLTYLVVVYLSLKTKNKALKFGLFGYYVVNLFGWPTVSTELLFWFWMSYALHETSTDILQ